MKQAQTLDIGRTADGTEYQVLALGRGGALLRTSIEEGKLHADVTITIVPEDDTVEPIALEVPGFVKTVIGIGKDLLKGIGGALGIGGGGGGGTNCGNVHVSFDGASFGGATYGGNNVDVDVIINCK